MSDPTPTDEGAVTEASPHADPSSRTSHLRQARTEFESHVASARDQFEVANERLKQRTGRDLIVAIAIGLAIGAVVLASILFFPWVFAVLATAIAVVATFELVRAFQGNDRRVDVVPQLVGSAAMVLGGYFGDLALAWALLFLTVAVIIVWRLVAQMAARDGRSYLVVTGDILAGALIPIYISFSAVLAVVLLDVDGGVWWVLSFLIIAVSSDTGAYAAGLSFGKHPMAPRISPNKTWEGFAGAGLAAAIAGVLLAWLALDLFWAWGLLLGAVILLTATIGDLGESMLKRDLGIKDMSSWLPGHGGVLDRLDSILPSAPAALAVYVILVPMGVA